MGIALVDNSAIATVFSAKHNQQAKLYNKNRNVSDKNRDFVDESLDIYVRSPVLF
ncbi:hypothetical protein [Nostoc sp. WHI]|uniref:hypothetical protein n=1 Tax=Nostoc sp. WHI TaxID=2650611 RepID=UPI0018C50DCB|nr:hypothetical protein [Nostoc sp. WHI]